MTYVEIEQKAESEVDELVSEQSVVDSNSGGSIESQSIGKWKWQLPPLTTSPRCYQK